MASVDIPVRYIDRVGTPRDEGGFVTLKVYVDGSPAEVLVLTTANFYDCLGRMVEEMMPGSADGRLN